MSAEKAMFGAGKRWRRDTGGSCPPHLRQLARKKNRDTKKHLRLGMKRRHRNEAAEAVKEFFDG